MEALLSFGRPAGGPPVGAPCADQSGAYLEAALLRRLQAVDECALGEFEARYGTALKGLIQGLVPDVSMAQDIWQECLLRL